MLKPDSLAVFVELAVEGPPRIEVRPAPGSDASDSEAVESFHRKLN
jgi:hypothetical protein